MSSRLPLRIGVHKFSMSSLAILGLFSVEHCVCPCCSFAKRIPKTLRWISAWQAKGKFVPLMILDMYTQYFNQLHIAFRCIQWTGLSEYIPTCLFIHLFFHVVSFVVFIFCRLPLHLPFNLILIHLNNDSLLDKNSTCTQIRFFQYDEEYIDTNKKHQPIKYRYIMTGDPVKHNCNALTSW